MNDPKIGSREQKTEMGVGYHGPIRSDIEDRGGVRVINKSVILQGIMGTSASLSA